MRIFNFRSELNRINQFTTVQNIHKRGEFFSVSCEVPFIECWDYLDFEYMYKAGTFTIILLEIVKRF